MAINVACACGKTYSVDDAMRGRSGRCQACGASFVMQPSSAGPSSAAGSPRRADVAPLPPEVGLPRAGAQSTFASNAARLRLDFKALLLQERATLAGTFFLLALSIPLIVRGYPHLILIPIALAIVWLFVTLLPLRSKLRSGDVTPAMIVSEKPWRVAIYADLTTGGGRRPAIKIVTVPMDRMTDGPPEVGMPVVAVSTYVGSVRSDAWSDFSPSILNLLTSKPGQIRRLLASVPAAEWNALSAGLARVDVTRDGLYKLWLDPRKNAGPAIGAAAQRAILGLAAAALVAVVCLGKPPGIRRAPMPPGPPGAMGPMPVRPPAVALHAEPADDATVARTRGRREAAVRAPSAASQPAVDSLEKRLRDRRATEAPSAAPAVDTTQPAGDRVEIQWGGRWWPGRVVRRDGARTRVHYDGWKETDDEWVTAERLRTPQK